MTRIDAIKDLCERYPYQKSARRMSEAEFDQMVAFIDDHNELGHLEFEYAVNRMFLDKPKPKSWAIVQELLIAANSHAWVIFER